MKEDDVEMPRDSENFHHSSRRHARSLYYGTLSLKRGVIFPPRSMERKRCEDLYLFHYLYRALI